MKNAAPRDGKLLLGIPLVLLSVAGVVWSFARKTDSSLWLPKSSNTRLLEFSPDSKRLVVVFQDTKTTLHTGRVYDLASRQKICDLATPPSLAEWLMTNSRMGTYYDWISWSPDGGSIVASNNGSAAVWDAQNGAAKADFTSTFTVARPSSGEIRFAPDGQTLIGDGFPPVTFSAATGQCLNEAEARRSEKTLAKPSGDAVSVAEMDLKNRSFRVYDSKTKRSLWKPLLHRLGSFEWQGETLCVKDQAKPVKGTAQRQERLLLWNGKSRRQIPSPPVESGSKIGDFCFNPAEPILAYLLSSTSTSDAELIAYDYQTNRVLWRTTSKTGLDSLQWSPDGKWLTAFTYDEESHLRLCLYDQTGQLHSQRPMTRYFAKWSPDSKQLATVDVEMDASGNVKSSRVEIERFGE